MDRQKRRIGIGFITGRKNFRDVLMTYINSWGSQALFAGEDIELSLFVAYDLDYHNTVKSDYTNLSSTIRDMLSEIHYIDPASLKKETMLLTQNGVLTAKESALFFEKGYAGKRNAVLYQACKEGVEALLFLDDDEYPMAVQHQNGMESWIGQEVLATHLKYIDEADITNGYHCGYISPIPHFQFNEMLTEECFQRFVEAISNDILNWENIKLLMERGNITYAEMQRLQDEAEEVMEVQRAKFISGSNLCLNLRDFSRISPFYNPPGARGEDTFLSTTLSERVVLRIPVYAFHDGFGMYTSMLKGVLPQKLRKIKTTSKRVANRFYQTCIGWVRYKPLFTYITQKENYEAIIQTMREDLTKTLPSLCAYFDNPMFMKILSELNRYDERVLAHYDDFMLTQDIWMRLTNHLKKSQGIEWMEKSNISGSDG